MFRRCFNIKQDLPINDQIRADKVQVIDENNEKLGEMQLNDALNLAYDKNLDLVLVSSNNPKVCKIMNYGKYKFEQSKKEKEARKKQKSFEMKEIRVTPNTDTHDFEFKAKNARKFLEDGNKLKITVRFRGREMNYKSQGEELLNKFIEALEDIANTEKRPIMEGKNMFIILTKKS
ncbi:MAG: translation initiation factor IF-3 [Clostridiales bacterium]|nr:translation initiation factor IF-3 [Clostridiales bacterium]